jgi:hypothetical protein
MKASDSSNKRSKAMSPTIWQSEKNRPAGEGERTPEENPWPSGPLEEGPTRLPRARRSPPFLDPLNTPFSM